jgi:enoyl-CoA hydratase
MSDAVDPVTTARHDQVAVITIDDGKANALSPALIERVDAAVAAAEADAEVRAIVLAGRPGRFSAGFDLSVFQAGDLGAVADMVNAGGRLVTRLYGGPKPVVAAATGHAMAAGALVVLACDHRVGVDGPVKIGLNEVAIGLVVPDWGLAVATDRLTPRHLQAAVVTARIYDGPGAVEAGYLDEVVEPERVLETAIERATAMVDLDATAYAGSVAAVRGATLKRMAADTGG